MNRYIFVVFGAIYFLIGMASGQMFLATTILLGLYVIMFLYAVFLTIKYRAMNPIILLGGTIFMILYTWFSWSNRSIIYQPDGLHSLIGLILIFYGILFAKNFETD